MLVAKFGASVGVGCGAEVSSYTGRIERDGSAGPGGLCRGGVAGYGGLVECRHGNSEVARHSHRDVEVSHQVIPGVETFGAD